MEHKFNYRWNFKDTTFTKDKGKVFSCFSCCGGSTMGYKLAGFDVIGCNEIDPRMLKVYVENHHPKYTFLEGIQTFKERDDIPEELYNLDILDGSPPCSTFSLAGSREDAWGKMKKFREGQAEQVLDTLFFDFIDLAKKLQPKIVIAENVKGMLIGNAKKYVDRIVEEFDKAGYYCVYNLLSGLDMGVPQKRERVFFTCIRKDLIEYIPYEENLFCEKVPIIKLRFDEKPVPYGEIKDGLGPDINPAARKLWEKRKPGQKSLGDVLKEEEGRDSYFNYTFAFDDEPVNTITAHRESNIVYDTGKFLSNSEVILASTFPLDYNFMTDVNSNITYVCGMSVPPVMMANVASNVYEQWLKPIKEKSGE